MSLSWSLSLLTASFLLAHALPRSELSTAKPKLVVSDVQEPQPMVYHQFITEHRPTMLGQNYYLKPGQLLGTFSLDSGTLHVRHEDSQRPISSRLNILYVATPTQQMDASTKNTLNA